MQASIDAMMSKDSLDRIAQAWHLEPQQLRERLRVDILPDASAAMVQFDGKDRYQAQRIVQDVLSRLMDQADLDRTSRVYEAAAENRPLTETPMRLELLDPASLPLNPSYPNRAIPAGIGLLIGISCAVLIGMRRLRRVAEAA